MIYLDTHVVLWLYLRKGDGLSQHARNLIEYESEIFISPILLLELDYLYEIKRTTLPSEPVYKYLHQQIDPRIYKITFHDVVLFASKLAWTRDPFDRIITAQSAIGNNHLITKDQKIRDHYEFAIW